jgi:hypothetical protein
MPDDRYRQHLERLGEDVVRYRLASRMPIGDGADNLPYDLARAWLAEKATERRKVESRRYWTVLLVAIVSATGAVIAAAPVIHDWIVGIPD